jgi:hypothetical protein
MWHDTNICKVLPKVWCKACARVHHGVVKEGVLANNFGGWMYTFSDGVCAARAIDFLYSCVRHSTPDPRAAFSRSSIVTPPVHYPQKSAKEVTLLILSEAPTSFRIIEWIKEVHITWPNGAALSKKLRYFPMHTKDGQL